MAISWFPLFAAANAALLAAALAWRAWGKRSWVGICAGLALAVGAVTIALVALDRADTSFATSASVIAEGTLTLLSGPLIVSLVCALSGANTPSLALMLAPFGAFLLAVLLGGVSAVVVDRLAFVQMAFTALAAWLVVRVKPDGARRVRGQRLAWLVVGAMLVLHLAQIARTLWPQALTQIVPLVGGCLFLALTCAVYFGGRLTALDRLTEQAPQADAQSRALVAKLDLALGAGLAKDSGLTLGQAAQAVDAAPEVLARALGALEGLTFIEYLQRQRVQAARRLLQSPEEARSSVEAIGLLVGFGSRSAFYKAFSEQIGVSPAKFRTLQAAKHVQEPETGQ